MNISFLLTVISLRLTIVRTIQGWIRPKNARSGRFFGFPISCSLLVYYLYYIWNKLYSFFKNIFSKLCTQKVYAQKACAQTCTQKPYAYKRRALKNTSSQNGVRLKSLRSKSVRSKRACAQKECAQKGVHSKGVRSKRRTI